MDSEQFTEDFGELPGAGRDDFSAASAKGPAGSLPLLP
jgi:hypothetical protein